VANSTAHRAPAPTVISDDYSTRSEISQNRRFAHQHYPTTIRSHARTCIIDGGFVPGNPGHTHSRVPQPANHSLNCGTAYSLPTNFLAILIFLNGLLIAPNLLLLNMAKGSGVAHYSICNCVSKSFLDPSLMSGFGNRLTIRSLLDVRKEWIWIM
jgi:hypothetical protein